MKLLFKTLVCLLLFVAVTDLSRSQDSLVAPVVVWNSFGPGNTYDTHTGWGIQGASLSGGYRAQAQPFVPGISGGLDTIELAIGKSSGSGRNNISLYSDAGGLPSGTLLDSFSNVASPGTFGQTYPLLTLSSAAHPLLQAGLTYWLTVEPADSTSLSAWNENVVASNGTFGYAFSPGGWNSLSSGPPGGAFRITIEPVPEPQTWMVTILAGLCLLGWRSSPAKGATPGAPTSTENS